MFTVLGLLCGRLVGLKSDNEEGEKRGAKIGALLAAPLDVFSIGYLCLEGIYQNNFLAGENRANLTKIENNVVEKADFIKFTENAFTVVKDDKKEAYYVDVFGSAITNVGNGPVFSQVTFECDKSFYEKALKYVGIDYTYGESNQVNSAENEFKKPDFWFSDVKSKFAKNDLIASLVNITEGEIVEKQLFMPVEHTNEVAEQATNGQFEVTGIGYVNNDIENKTASFTIDMVDVTKKSLAMKKLTVEMPLTEEIKKDSQKAYEFYVKHTGECKISAKTLAKENLMTILGKDGKESYVEFSAENCEM